MATDQPSERRLKAYRISESDILFFLRRYDKWPEFLSVTTDIQGPPNGCTMEWAYYRPDTRCFWVVVSHPDFDESPCGCEIPRATEPLTMEWSVLARGEDGAYRLHGANSGAEHTIIGHPVLSLSAPELRSLRDKINERLYDLENQRHG